ncbi:MULTISPECIES: MarR family transcriptional regulator [unclassified Streptomyces]|uniref:MarR family winged helix-turn-helix transcriptional regulator n=1 Tax=unclassified Streptomyces TaxID=2593676 RepID=UPI00035D8AC1|nr:MULTISPECIES: MarR family transcriptional regulator [unclassified Streptomyces]MYT32179.1 MarR family transcriptional regulator [Streptomyces sp. SID8354]
METDEASGRLGELFLNVAKQVRARQAERFAPFGITPAQARVLGLLARSGTPPRMTELAERLGVVPRAVTPLIDALEAAGLVRRLADPDNRRSTLVELTDQGSDMRRSLHAERVRVVEDVFAPLTPRQRATLLDLLGRL